MKGQGSRVRGQGTRFSAVFILSLLAYSLQLTASYAESERSGIWRVDAPFLKGDYEKAIYEAGRLIDSGSRQGDEAYYLKGLSELKLGRFRDARGSFQKITSKYAGSKRAFDSYLGIGDSYFLEGDMDNALKTYHDILKRYPDDKNIPVVYARIADCSKKTLSHGKAEGYFSVQAGSFKNKRNAERLALKLRNMGFSGFIEEPSITGDKMYRVKIGKFHSKGEAEAAAARLKKSGYSAKICLP